MDIVTLIPAFKPKYLPDLLNCLRVQTVRPSRIIFSDDTRDGSYRTTLMSDALAPLRAGLPIECHDGPQRGGYPNMLHLLDIWDESSSLVHLLLDDDVIYPEFYARHLVAHASGRFSCSISRRWTASENGQPLQGQQVPPAVNQAGQRIVSLDASVVFLTTAVECRNWFGEFSNAVLRAETVPLLRRPQFEGVSYAGLWDLGAFMAASLAQPVAHIQDYLGFFRTGGQGNSSKFFGPYMKAAHLGYAALGLGGRRLGMYTESQARKCFAIIATALAQRYASQDDMLNFIALMPRLAQGDGAAEAEFIQGWHAYLQLHDF